MATKTTLRAEIRGRRRAHRALSSPQMGARSSHTDQAPLPVRHRAEAGGIASQVRALASSMGGVTLPALFVSTPLEPDMSLALGLFPRALLPVLLDEAGDALGEPRWGLWEAGSALATPGPPPAQPAGEALGSQALAGADLILIPALAASEDGTRLGQGGGWYDRTLPHRAPLGSDRGRRLRRRGARRRPDPSRTSRRSHRRDHHPHANTPRSRAARLTRCQTFVIHISGRPFRRNFGNASPNYR